MKQWMESAITFRKMSSDFLTKARQETQAPAREDIDAAMQTVHHMEARVLDRMEDLARQVEALAVRLDKLSANKPAARAPGSGRSRAKNQSRGKRKSRP
jgi:hypothetical protein